MTISNPSEPASLDFSVGDVLLEQDSGLAIEPSTSYQLQKEFILGIGGTLRIKFDMKSNGGETAAGQINRNGSPVGTEQSQGSTFATKSEDISGWSSGDLVQLYAKSQTGTYDAHCKNFKLYVLEHSGAMQETTV